MAGLGRPGYRFALVEDGDKFYVEVSYRHLTARVRVYSRFDKTYKAVKRCLRHSMNCKVGEELRHQLKSFHPETVITAFQLSVFLVGTTPNWLFSG